MAGDEFATLKGFLEFQRATTLAWKTEGLTAEQFNATAAKSTMTLGGMLKRLAYVEQQWFHTVLHDREPLEPWASVDWKADNDWDCDLSQPANRAHSTKRMSVGRKYENRST